MSAWGHQRLSSVLGTLVRFAPQSGPGVPICVSPLCANFVAKVVVASSQATPLRSKGFDIARYSVGSSGFDAQLALTPSTQRYLTLKLHTQRTAEAVARSAWRAAAGSVRWPQV